MSRLPLKRLVELLRPLVHAKPGQRQSKAAALHPEKLIVAQRIAQDLVARMEVLLELGLGYL